MNPGPLLSHLSNPQNKASFTRLGQIASLCIWQKHWKTSATIPITCGYSMPQEPELPTWGLGQTEAGARPSRHGSSKASNTLLSFCKLPKAGAGAQAVGNSTRPWTPQKWVLVPASLFPKNRQATGMSCTLCQGALKPPACQGSSQTDPTGVAGTRVAPGHCQVCHGPYCVQEDGTLGVLAMPEPQLQGYLQARTRPRHRE